MVLGDITPTRSPFTLKSQLNVDTHVVPFNKQTKGMLAFLCICYYNSRTPQEAEPVQPHSVHHSISLLCLLC